MAIVENPVKLSQYWGVQFNEYSIANETIDFQDLMVKISEHRAVAVEKEVTPLTTRIKKRNAYLSDLGDALADATKIQAQFKSEDAGTTVMSGWFSEKTTATLRKAGCADYFNDTNFDTGKERADATKAGIEGIVSKVKSVIDGLNNASQTDMTRLQSLVDRRDESYSTATNLMTEISDTRSNLIRNL